MFSFRKKKKQLGYTRAPIAQGRISPFWWQVIFGFLALCACGLVVAATWYVAHIQRFQITSVAVVGGVTISHEEVRSQVNETLAGTYLRLVPRTFIPFYPKEEIQNVLATMPRMKHVHVEHVSPQTLAVAFEEYVPFALWCEHKESKDCIFVDTLGFGFAQAPTLEGSAFIRFIEAGKKPELRSSVFGADFLKSSVTFSELLTQKLNLYVTHVEKKGDYDVEYTLASGGVVKVSQKSAPQTTFDDLETILTSKEFSHIAPGAFEYIDLRFGDKVFVREVPPVATSTATSTRVD